MEAMSAWEESQHRRATDGRGRFKSTLERLPKGGIQNLYRNWIAAPRNEDKADMVSILWRNYQVGDKAAAFWQDVHKEWDYADRCKAAKAAGLPKPRY